MFAWGSQTLPALRYVRMSFLRQSCVGEARWRERALGSCVKRKCGSRVVADVIGFAEPLRLRRRLQNYRVRCRERGRGFSRCQDLASVDILFERQPTARE